MWLFTWVLSMFFLFFNIRFKQFLFLYIIFIITTINYTHTNI